MFRYFYLRLRTVSQRRFALGLLLTQALIFLLDTVTGAVLSFAPFYSIPVALAAWRLPRATVVLFVLIASLARVVDFSNDHASTLMLLALDLMQSMVFYALVAVLTWQMRLTFDRVARHAHSLKRKARSERHQRVLDSTIRRAVLEDVPAILRLTSVGGEDGAFDAVVTQAPHQAALQEVFRRGITDGVALRDAWGGGPKITVPIEFWVSEIDGQLAGYMMVLGLDANKGAERELHAIAIDPALRGHGLGTLMVNFFCNRFQHRRLLVACKYNSRMFHMLQRRHFKFQSSSDGYEIMALG